MTHLGLSRPLFGLMVAETLLWGTLFYSFPVLVPQWQAGFGWSNPLIMGAFTCALLVTALSAPFFGRLVDRGYGAQLMGLSAAGGAVLLLALSMVTSLPMFYAIWIGLGLAMGGCLYETSFAIATRTNGARAKQMITWITLVAGFASTLAYPAFAVIAQTHGWRTAILGAAIIVSTIASPLAYLSAHALERSRRPDAPAPPDAPPVPQTAYGQKFWLLVLSYSLFSLTIGIMISHLFPILADRGVAPAQAILAGALIGPMQVLGRLAVMLAGTRWSHIKTAIVAFVSVAVGAGFMAVSGSGAVFMGLFVIGMGCGYGVAGIMRPVLTRDLLGDRGFGAISGAVALPALFSFALAPTIGAAIFAIGGYDMVLAVCVASAVIGAGSIWIAGRDSGT
jgi:MFS family permease